MNRSDLLQRLRQKYGISKSLLEKLKEKRYKEIPIQNTSSTQNSSKTKQRFFERVICIRNENDLDNYKKEVKNVSIITNFLMNNNLGRQYVRYMDQYVERVKKEFQKIGEINEETTDIIAKKVVKLVKNNLLSYLKGCYLGMYGNNSEEQKVFYQKFANIIEQYLQSIGIYEKKINIGISIKEDGIIDMFQFIKKPTNDESLVDKINEIEIQPHYIKFINEDEEEASYYIEGLCVIFVK